MTEIVRHGRIDRESALTIGFFDGVHRGHRHLLERVKETAMSRGLASVCLTFDKHPRAVLQNGYLPKLITTLEEKVWLIEERSGLDYCVVEEFTKELAEKSAEEFMEYLKERYRVKALLIGYDHRFGKGRNERMEDYVRYGNELGIEVIGVEAEEMKGEGGREISSTLIRRCVEEGRIEEANAYLGHPYYIFGEVVEGFRLGRTIGFPTANISVEERKLVAGEGVYAVRIKVKGKWYGGMLYIGSRPTVNTGMKSIEANIFDFDEEIYTEKVVVEFVGKIRGERKFEGVEELRKQLCKDKEETIKMLNTENRE